MAEYKLSYTAREIEKKLSEVVDQTYSAKSSNAQSGIAVAEAVAGIVNAAPETLDTLNELSAALGDDPNFSVTILNEINQKAGKKTSEGGEVFNDYENNQAIAENTFASGGSTQAGGKAFGIVSYKTKTAEENGTVIESVYTLTSGNGLEELLEGGMAYSLYFENPEVAGLSYGNFDYYGEIVSVDAATATITVSNGFKADRLPNITENALFIIPEYSHLGDKTIGSGSTAQGWGARAINAVSDAIGYNTLAAGKYAHAQNLRAIAGGYASDAGGWDTQALAKASFTRGKDNIVRSGADNAAAFGEGHDIKWSDNFAVGKYSNNANPRLFLVGMGTSDVDRKNAFEVRTDGMCLTGKAGTVGVHNSIPQMWQLEEKAPKASPVFTGRPQAPTVDKGDNSQSIATTEFVQMSINEFANTELPNYIPDVDVNIDLTEYVKRRPLLNDVQFLGTNLYNINTNDKNRGAVGARSLVNGDHCNAKGINAGAFGNWSAADFANSFAFGNRTVTRNANQTVVGVDNAPEDDTTNPSLFTVGNGTSNSAKSTAFNVRTDGSADVQTMGTKDNSVATKKYVDDATIETKKYVDVATIEATIEKVNFDAQDFSGGSAVDGWFTITNLEMNTDGEHYWHVELSDPFPSDTNWCVVDYNTGLNTLHIGMEIYLKMDEGASDYSESYYSIPITDRVTHKELNDKMSNVANLEKFDMVYQYIPTPIEEYIDNIWYTITSVTQSNTSTYVYGKSKDGKSVGIIYISLQGDMPPIGGLLYNGEVYLDINTKANKEYVDNTFAQKTYMDMLSMVDTTYIGGYYVDVSGLTTIKSLANNIITISDVQGQGDYIELTYIGSDDSNKYFKVGDIVNIQIESGILTRFEIKSDLRHYVSINEYKQLETRLAEIESHLGQVETSLDEIIKIQNTLIGGEN